MFDIKMHLYKYHNLRYAGDIVLVESGGFRGKIRPYLHPVWL